MRETDRDGDGVRNGGSCSNRGLTAAEKQPNKGWSSRATEAQTDSRDNRPNVESEDEMTTETEEKRWLESDQRAVVVAERSSHRIATVKAAAEKPLECMGVAREGPKSDQSGGERTSGEARMAKRRDRNRDKQRTTE